jgi:outer membrane protein OmpA-like peptidoglycan-associated protein
MKILILFSRGIVLAITLIFACQYTQAQFLKRLKEKVVQTASDHVTNDAGNATDKTINKTEGAAKKGGNSSSSNNSSSGNSASAGSVNSSALPSIKTYKNYDFVPGNKIIFQSNLAADQTGSLPSQFTVTDGQMDVQNEDGENVIHVPTGSGAHFSPRMTSTNYLPDQFTIEFDVKNEKAGLEHLTLKFGDEDGNISDIGLAYDGVSWTTGGILPPEDLHLNYDYPMKWHHIAIAVNKNQGKIYIDQTRVVNVNNLTGNAKAIIFIVDGYEDSFIKNIRVASGGIDIDKKVITDGKIVMHGILFDVDKAALLPESMGSINEIYNLLKKDASLKFEIDGHTDNTGNAAHNLTLSQQRADAVKAQLVSMGIDGSRLSTKGFGDTKPISDNSSPEGKANNRRVEFVKI